MTNHDNADKLISFLNSAHSVFHAVDRISRELDEAGFCALRESEAFRLEPGRSYYVKRNNSSLIAFRLPRERFTSARLISAHTDSPVLKIKPSPIDTSSSAYSTLNVEVYGGLPLFSWFDRPLSIAGRVFTEGPDGLQEHLVDIDRDLVVIPSLAIHQNRQVNDGWKISVQKEMKPVLSAQILSTDFPTLLSRQLKLAENVRLLDYDLYLYSRTPASVWGLDGEFISAGRLDDLMCLWAAFEAFKASGPSSYLQLAAFFDNEEVGSGSRQGALSDFLVTTYRRILSALGFSYDESCAAAASSMMLSADNGHALHPNYTEKCDPTNRPVINGGVLIKYAANQKYATDGCTASWLKSLMNRKGIKYQSFANNSDVTGGSTLGNLSAQRLSIPCVDIGLAQLAMHSAWESAGVSDLDSLLSLFSAFLED